MRMMIDDDYDALLDLREECLNYAKKRNEAILAEWFSRIKFKGTVGYYNDYRTFTIYTKYPGLLIGKCGCNIDILKSILKREFNNDYEIKFVEVRGGFITSN